MSAGRRNSGVGGISMLAGSMDIKELICCRSTSDAYAES